MRILAVDIGQRRTGVAYLDEDTGIPLPLDTIAHSSVRELIQALSKIVDERSISSMIVGLPLLPSGKEGAQAKYVNDVVSKLKALPCRISLIDERYSSPRKKHPDPDAFAAWNLLQTAYSIKPKKS